MKSKFKSMFSSFASFALAAVVVFASGTCSAVTIIKPSSVSRKSKSSITVKWKGKSGAKGYTVLRAYEKKDIRYAEVAGEYPSNYRKMIDRTAKLGYKYYYWVVPKGEQYWKVSSSQSKKCGMGYRFFEVKLTEWPKSTCKRGIPAYLGATINGKPLGTSGVKWSVVKSGVHKWHKATNGSGRIGYFTSSKKGKGTYYLKVGVTSVAKFSKRTVTWK